MCTPRICAASRAVIQSVMAGTVATAVTVCIRSSTGGLDEGAAWPAEVTTPATQPPGSVYPDSGGFGVSGPRSRPQAPSGARRDASDRGRLPPGDDDLCEVFRCRRLDPGSGPCVGGSADGRGDGSHDRGHIVARSVLVHATMLTVPDDSGPVRLTLRSGPVRASVRLQPRVEAAVRLSVRRRTWQRDGPARGSHYSVAIPVSGLRLRFDSAASSGAVFSAGCSAWA
jgi:hypothetical protein